MVQLDLSVDRVNHKTLQSLSQSVTEVSSDIHSDSVGANVCRAAAADDIAGDADIKRRLRPHQLHKLRGVRIHGHVRRRSLCSQIQTTRSASTHQGQSTHQPPPHVKVSPHTDQVPINVMPFKHQPPSR